jgi:beta-galactosidase
MNPIQIQLPGILHGGDYNPEQWPEEVWDEDMRLMREANVNIATLPVFGWVSLQTDEETFTFEWLDSILERMEKNGIKACLATATASQPAWLDQKYPDVLIVEESGHKRKHGQRHSFCPNSPNFRRLSTNLARRIAQRYKEYSGLVLWHVGNEYGRSCYCDQCGAAFRGWLREKYGSLQVLNARWYTAFWGHTFTDWSQIEPPTSRGERSMQALRLDYCRFQSESLLNCYRAEAAVLREVTPDIPITTNLMGPFQPLDYHKWAQEMDIVSWDCYPGPHDPPEHVAFSHALMRGLKEGQPFLLMEQSPSQQNWQPYNWLKAPGLLRLQSFQAMAQGADSIMYFQWRRGRGGIEMLHGAVVEHHAMNDARVFREVSQLGAQLKQLDTSTLGGRVPARVALLFDWENWWALSFGSGPSVDLDYLEECRAYFSAFYQLGIQVNVLSPDADLSSYDLIIAPLLYMVRSETADQIVSRVTAGATFLTTYFSALVDENDLVHPGGAPGPLREVLGLRVEETDALPRDKKNGLRFEQPLGDLTTDAAYPADLLCDRIRLEGASTLARYSDDFYAGEAGLTRNNFGGGAAYYLATRPEAGVLRCILSALCEEKEIRSPLENGSAPPAGVEVTERVSPDGSALLYLLNHNLDEVEVKLTGEEFEDLLSEEKYRGALRLGARAAAILRRKDER